MNKLVYCTVSTAMLFAVALPASATIIVEGVDYADAPNAMIGSLGAGSHTISGTLAGNCSGPAPFSCLFGADPEDTLTFSIVPTARLVDISFSIFNDATLEDAFGMSFTYNSALEGFSFGNLLTGVYSLGGPGISPVSGDITLILAGDEASSNIDYTATWSVDLEVSTVPLPSTVLLLGAGILGAAGFRRNQLP